jgi:hypothetical protein
MQATPNDHANAAIQPIRITTHQVTVRVTERLGLESWREIRDARESARSKALPLVIDLGACPGSTMAGIALLLIVKDRLGTLAVSGCSHDLPWAFNRLGICGLCENARHCGNDRQPAPHA